MATITKQFSVDVRESLEDMVSYLTQEAYEAGELVSGETVYTVISCMVETKLAEFRGDLSV